MKHFQNFNKKYKHFYSLIIFIILISWFEYLKFTIVPKYIMYCSFDSKIPFIKEFIIPYYMWFAYMAAAFLYLGKKSKTDFYKLLLFLSLNMSISYILYMIFPNGQFARPSVPGKDVFSQLVLFIYSHDATNNVCPSIHVANAIGVHLALVNYSYFKENHKAANFISLVLMILISASTVFVKQHSILDVLAGALLSIIIYLGIYQLPRLFASKSAVIKYDGNDISA